MACVFYITSRKITFTLEDSCNLDFYRGVRNNYLHLKGFVVKALSELLNDKRTLLGWVWPFSTAVRLPFVMPASRIGVLGSKSQLCFQVELLANEHPRKQQVMAGVLGSLTLK